MHPGRWFNETAFDSLDYLVPALLLFSAGCGEVGVALLAPRVLTRAAHCAQPPHNRRRLPSLVGRARQASLVAVARWAGLGASRGLASNAVQLDELPRAAGNVAAPATGLRGPGRRAHGG